MALASTSTLSLTLWNNKCESVCLRKRRKRRYCFRSTQFRSYSAVGWLDESLPWFSLIPDVEVQNLTV